MNNKFKNKYRIPSARLQNWDYGNNASYFITICSKNKEHFFGEIGKTDFEAEMLLNEIGKLAEKFWIEIPNHFKFIELGNFVVMPNHFHGILIINKPADVPDVETQFIASLKSTNKTGGITGNKNPMFYENISRIVRWYKGRCKFEMRIINPSFQWQPRFHDNIIRNAKSFERVQNYIANNPTNWKDDKFYS